MSKKEFVMGDTVVWNPGNLNQSWWETLTEEERIRYYGDLGYGQDKPKHFTFICHHRPQYGHCTLIAMDTRKVETMRHTGEFDLVDEDEG